MYFLQKLIINIPLLFNISYLKYVRTHMRPWSRMCVTRRDNGKDKGQKNSQKVTFNAAVADLRVLCVQVTKGD